jgi:hypothetical protein
LIIGSFGSCESIISTNVFFTFSSKELTELQKKQNTYLFDGKKLTLYDIPSDNITLLAFENKFYVKNKNDFYVLTVANEPQQFSKVIDDALKENLEKILFDNGKFE